MRLSTLILIVSALWMAGCQAHATRPEPSPSSDSAAPMGATYWQDRYESLASEYRLRLSSTCQKANALARQSCVHDAILASFGSSGGASAHCSGASSEFAFMECALVGSVAERLLSVLGPEAGQGMRWNDPQGSLSLAFKLAGDRAADECRRPATSQCFAREMGIVAGLFPSVAEQCAALPLTSEQSHCIAYALLVDELERALLYVG